MKADPKETTNIDYGTFIEQCRLAYGEVSFRPSFVPVTTEMDAEDLLPIPVSASQAFLRIPWEQIYRLRKARVPLSAVFVYLIVWRQSMMQRTKTVVLTSAMLAPFELSRWDKARALTCLEQRGLIQVEHRRKKNPVVTVRHVASTGPTREGDQHYGAARTGFTDRT